MNINCILFGHENNHGRHGRGHYVYGWCQRCGKNKHNQWRHGHEYWFDRNTKKFICICGKVEK